MEGRIVERERYQELKRIFLDALELTGKNREGFLEQTCGADEELRRLVEELLAEHATLNRADHEHGE